MYKSLAPLLNLFLRTLICLCHCKWSYLLHFLSDCSLLVKNEHFLNNHILMCMFAHSCPTLCNPMDCSLASFSVHGIFQARILEWFAISFSRGSFRPWDWTHISWIGRQFFSFVCLFLFFFDNRATWEAHKHFNKKTFIWGSTWSHVSKMCINTNTLNHNADSIRQNKNKEN